MAVRKIDPISEKKLDNLDSLEERLVSMQDRMARLGLADSDSGINFSSTMSYLDVARKKINDEVKFSKKSEETITENTFFNMLSVIEAMDDVSFVDGYYPTVEQLKVYRIEKKINKYLPMLLFYASNPFGRTGEEGRDDEEYIKLVRYCKALTAEVNLKIS